LTCDPVADWCKSLHRTQCHGLGESDQRRTARDARDGSHKVSLDQVIATMRQTD